jgi:glycosyltransferase involved in cell wall biosynthesis
MQQPRLVFGLTVAFSTILFGDLLSRMIDEGWEVHLILGESIPPTLAVDSRIHVHVVTMERRIEPFQDLKALKSWVRIMKEIRPDVCVGATPKAALLAMMAARMTAVPNRIFQVWGAKWDGAKGFRGLLLRRADQVAVWCSTETVACSQSLADLLVFKRVSRARPLVLEFGGTKGVNLVEFFPAKSLRAQPRKNKIIGFVGRVAHDKGVDSLIRVFQHVSERLPGTQLTVVGPIDGTDPISAGALAALESTPGIRMVGHQAEIAAYMREFDVLCFPSVREGLPNVVIEAAACGVPAVAWDVTGSSDAVIHDLTGFLIPFLDEDEMSARIISILKDGELHERLSIGARRFAEERFDSRNVIGNQISYFNQLIGRERE